MMTVELAGPGGVDTLRIVYARAPTPGAGQLLVRVEAAGVIFADILLRRGEYVVSPNFPHVPGREVAGVVTEVGDGVTGYEVGQRVYAFMMGGGYAEYAVVDVADGVGPAGRTLGRTVYHLGDGIDPAQALSHGSNLRIAHLILHGRAAARPGQSVLIHAAAGGVGAHLTRLARGHGMLVYALAGSPEKAAYCRANGAHHVIEYRLADVPATIRDLTEGRGIDIAINSVGGDTLMRDAEMLAWEGQLLITGKAAGAGAVVPSTAGKSLTYKHFASYTHMGRPEDDRACEMVAQEMLEPTALDRIIAMPLENVREAHALMESGRSFGKIVLIPSERTVQP